MFSALPVIITAIIIAIIHVSMIKKRNLEIKKLKGVIDTQEHLMRYATKKELNDYLEKRGGNEIQN